MKLSLKDLFREIFKIINDTKMDILKGSIAYELTPEELDSELFDYISNVDGSLFVKHYLCWSSVSPDPDEASTNNTLLNGIYRRNKENYLESVIQKDYESAVWYVEKPARLLWFDDNHIIIFDEIGEERYYRLLAEVLVNVEFHYYSKDLYNKLISVGNNPHFMMNEEEKIFFDSLPETIPIYRGINSENEFDSDKIRDYLGYSWSLDKTKAEWFARRWSCHSNRLLLSTTIEKTKAISCFLERNEKEIWIDFNELKFESLTAEVLV